MNDTQPAEPDPVKLTDSERNSLARWVAEVIHERLEERHLRSICHDVATAATPGQARWGGTMEAFRKQVEKCARNCESGTLEAIKATLRSIDE